MEKTVKNPFFFFALSFVLIFLLPIPKTMAGDSEVQILREEVRELKKSVQQLTDTVRSQNQRIDELSGRQAPPSPTSHAEEDIAPRTAAP
jgi:hypothetical protein